MKLDDLIFGDGDLSPKWKERRGDVIHVALLVLLGAFMWRLLA